jgi:hypothetical protein
MRWEVESRPAVALRAETFKPPGEKLLLPAARASLSYGDNSTSPKVAA